MNLSLDDDTAERRFVALFMRGGHRVVRPVDVDLVGASDAQHVMYAIRHALVLVTRNHDDVLDVHEVIQAAHGTHPGMRIIRFDNDPTRDRTARQIVRALAALERAGVPLTNHVSMLNHWR